MQTDYKTQTVPERYEDVIYNDNFPSPHQDHLSSQSQSVTHKWLSYSIYHEEITPNSGGRFGDWKSFEHYARRMDNHSNQVRQLKTTAWTLGNQGHYHVGDSADIALGYQEFTTLDVPHWGPYGEPGAPISGLPVMYSKRADGGFIPEPDKLDALKQQSLNVMMPRVKEELSLVNSLIELKDFKSLPRTLGNFANLKNVLSFKGPLSLPLRYLLQSTADGYLQYAFNLKPLLSDVQGIFSALSRTEKRMNDLISRSGKKLTRHFRYAWDEFDTVNQSTGSPHKVAPSLSGPANGTFWTKGRDVVANSSIFHAEVQYNYNYAGYQVEHARLLSLLDSFGVNLNPAIIWNAIPWSFVVDWLVGVNRWLSQFQMQNMEPKINIHRYLWSVTRRRSIVPWCSENYTEGTIPPDNNKYTLPRVVETAYRRSVGLPGVSSIISSGLSSNEFSLAAALVVARRRQSKTRR